MSGIAVGNLAIIRLLALLLTLAALPGIAAEDPPGRYLGAVQTHYPDWFKPSFLDLAEDVAEAAEAGKRLMIFFHQDGCPYCNRLVERNLSQKDIQDLMRSRLEVVEINMWGDREVTATDGRVLTEKEFAAALRVQFTPTLLFFDERGELLLRLNGYIPPAEFRIALEYVTAEGAQGTGYRQFLSTRARARGGGRLIPQPYFMSPPYRLDLREPGRPLAVLFEQRDCPNCQRLHHDVLSDPGVGKLLQQFDVVQLDMWSDTPLITPNGRRSNAREWASQLEVSFAPTLVLFNASGQEVIRSEAWFKRFHSAGILDYLLSGAYQKEPSFQRFLSQRAEHIRERGEDVDIWR